MSDFVDPDTRQVTAPAVAGQGEPFLRAVVESIVLLLLLRSFESIFFGGGHFATLTLHPFWIVVLLSAVQHGVFAGIATVGLAALMMDWPPRPIGVDITVHYLDLALLPLEWLVAALTIGLFRQSQIWAARRIEAENARLRDVNETLADEVHRLDAVVHELEIAAVTRPGDAVDPPLALEGLAALYEARPDNLLDRFRSAADSLHAASGRLLLASAAGRFVDAAGGADAAGLEARLERDHPLLDALRQGSEAVIVTADVEDGDASPRRLVLMGVRPHDGRAPAGLVVIALDGEGAEEAAQRAAGLLARATAAALRQALAGAPEAHG